MKRETRARSHWPGTPDWMERQYYQDYKLGEMGRVRHVRNGGEVQVLTPAETVFVDGFEQETNTIYEFYGCYFHWCPRCFPTNQDVPRNCHKDRTTRKSYPFGYARIQDEVDLLLDL